MLLFLEDEDLQDMEFMNALQDELNEAEKICRNYEYDSEFFIDTKKKQVKGEIYPKKKYAPSIYIEDDRKFDIEIQTTSYGHLSLYDYIKFVDACRSACNMVADLKSNFYLCSQLVKD